MVASKVFAQLLCLVLGAGIITTTLADKTIVHPTDVPPLLYKTEEIPPVVAETEKGIATVLVNGCTITMPTDIPDPEPVYVITTTPATPKLLWPEGQETTLPTGSKLTLYCAGSGNLLGNLNQQSLELTCMADGTFYSAEKSQTYTLNQLACSRIPNSELLVTTTTCSSGQGKVYEAGFPYGTGFLSVFTICYNPTTETTIYARSLINGKTQNYKIIQSVRRAFRAEGMRFTTTATNNFYTIANQITIFQGLFGTAQTYVSNSGSKFLARGHLSPDADFIFSYEQLATYFYTNCAPEWQLINAGNWIRVENLARNLAIGFDSDLLTYTSTLGVLQLPTSASVMKSIYLDSGALINAPLWYYKILVHPSLPTSLVMITQNNPYASTGSGFEFCTNVCDLYGINSPFFTDISRGYTFCCTYADFIASVIGAPTFDLPTGWSF